jgi:hypothetical protein
LRAELTDCRRRCLNARRAASSFSDSCDQRVPPDARDISDPTDVADDADDDSRRITDRRLREPCCRFVDVLRARLVRGTCGGRGRCGRQGGTMDARGGGEHGERRVVGVVGGRVTVLEGDGAEGGSGTPRMCTMPAPSRVSSSVHGREVTDAVDAARLTAGGVVCCQS